MKRGPKAEPPSTKRARGTFQPVRDGLKTEIPVAANPPIRPDYLSPAAIDVWNEVIERVTALGITATDSALLARYCALEAEVRAAFQSEDGELPSAAYLTNLRQMEELLRIAGPKSRVGGGGADGSKPASRFAGRGARNRA